MIAKKNLAEIVDTKNKETKLSDNGDQFVLNKLKEMGYKSYDHQKLFELFMKMKNLVKKYMLKLKRIQEKNLEN